MGVPYLSDSRLPGLDEFLVLGATLRTICQMQLDSGRQVGIESFCVIIVEMSHDFPAGKAAEILARIGGGREPYADGNSHDQHRRHGCRTSPCQHPISLPPLKVINQSDQFALRARLPAIVGIGLRIHLNSICMGRKPGKNNPCLMYYSRLMGHFAL